MRKNIRKRKRLENVDKKMNVYNAICSEKQTETTKHRKMVKHAPSTRNGHAFSSAKPGTGARFRACVNTLQKRNVRDPAAACAMIGRRKFGHKRFAQMAVAGRKKH